MASEIITAPPLETDDPMPLAHPIDDVRLPGTMTPTERTNGEITALLDAWRRGEGDALGRLMEVVEQELRIILTARDMAGGGSWLIPHYLGELRLEKSCSALAPPEA